MTEDDYTIGLLSIGVLKLVTYLSFLAFYVVRINKLDKLASNTLEKDRSLKFRVCGVALLIFLDILHIILSYFDPYYYLHSTPNYSLINILSVFDLILQIYIITREHKKKTRRSRSVIMFWVFIAAQQISTIVIVQVYQPNIGIILPILELIICVVLIVLTFLIEPSQQSNLSTFKQTMRQSNLLTLHQNIYSKNTEHIYIEFNKEFQVSIQDTHYEFSFKIAVYILGNFHIITKSETQFYLLSKQLAEFFPEVETVLLSPNAKNYQVSNVTKHGQQVQKKYQSYLINLTKTNDFYCQPLMNFLQIPDSQKKTFQTRKFCVLKKDSLNSDEQQKDKRPFFAVSWKNNKIHVSNPQILQFYVNKSISDIINFQNKLIAEKRLSIQLLSENPNQSQLAHFIFRACNSKSLWKSFAEWMCLGITIEEKIENMLDFWSQGFENIELSVIGHETSFDKNNSVIYLYLISIQNKKKKDRDVKMLKKRFNDFSKLDQNIRKFIGSENMRNVHLPSLPPKFSPFESKTSPNSRQVYFDSYLKALLRIEGINHCIKLLEFLEINSQMLYVQQLKQKSEKVNSEIFDSIFLDQLQIQK